jgi:hypothetical protein
MLLEESLSRSYPLKPGFLTILPSLHMIFGYKGERFDVFL